MISKKVVIINEVGIHARPACKVVNYANNFKSSVKFVKDNRTANAKSLLNLLALGCTKGSEITVVAEGIDEEMAVDGIVNFISNCSFKSVFCL